MSEKDLNQRVAALEERPGSSLRLLVMFVFVVSVFTLLAKLYASGEAQQQCGDEYAAAQYAAQTPIDAAQLRLNAADAIIWQANQAILTQQAGPDDFKALRLAIRHRNTLWAQLVSEKEAHPVPPPPDQFC